MSGRSLSTALDASRQSRSLPPLVPPRPRMTACGGKNGPIPVDVSFMKTIAPIVLAALPFFSAAQATQASSCGATVFDVAGRFTGFSNFSPLNRERVVAATCKAASGSPGVQVAAFAYSTQPVGKQMSVDEAKELAVMLIDAGHRRVLASYKQRVDEDALTRIDEHSLSLDSASYLFVPGVRAYGLRFHSAAGSASCADQTFDQLLSLFVTSGTAMRPVLRLNMSVERAISGCIGAAVPGYVVEPAMLTVAIAPTSSHGYADLVVRAKIAPFGSETAKHVPKQRSETRTLRYDGQRYVVPEQEVWWLKDVGL